MIKIFPQVASSKILAGTYNKPECLKCFFENTEVNVFSDFSYNYQIISEKEKANLFFKKDESLKEEEYEISINNEIIKISYNKPSGAFYALKTLEQILEGNTISNLEVKDYPAIKTRGFLLDISRDKVPKLETIKDIIKIMAKLKMNQFQLYVEGFSYEYKSFAHFLEKDSFITVEEYYQIEKFCHERFIDLVPNQNGFGHMAKWLEKDEYKNLAIEENGIYLWGRHRKPSTINPLDQRSLELVKKMYQDMIPLFKSKYFNMNFDEPFELGHGKTKDLDKVKVFVDYTLKVYDEIKKYNKTPQIWADVIINHPESWSSLPKDMIFIDWGYDAFYPFEKNAEKLKNANVSFMLAPGTTSWCSFLGRFYDYYENIKKAIDASFYYQGEGVLLTDWGDFGHLQHLPITYAPLTYMGLYSWARDNTTILDLRTALNKFILKDKNNIIGDLLLDLSCNYKYEIDYMGNGTKTFYTFMWACSAIVDTKGKNDDSPISENSPLGYFNKKMQNTTLTFDRYNQLKSYLDQLENKISNISLKDNCDLVKKELKLGIKIIKDIQKLSVSFDQNLDIDIRINLLREIINDNFIEKQKEVWLTRNKSGGLESSISYLENFYAFVLLKLNNLEEEKKNEKKI